MQSPITAVIVWLCLCPSLPCHHPLLQVPASSISFANTFGVLFTVVVYDLVIVPLTAK
jgi:hypothetical protein